MKHVTKGVENFQRDVYPKKKELFDKLASGQSPEVLFITCADSRIDPSLITQTEPGDLFVCRNAGNVVPPQSDQAEGTVGSIEFAVAALGVSHIVVCGHSDCGAMKGALNPDGLDSVPNVKNWLEHCRCAADALKERHGRDDLSLEDLEEITRENVVQQLNHLKTHPAVAAKLDEGKVQLHGWVYDIGAGDIVSFDESRGEWRSLQDMNNA